MDRNSQKNIAVNFNILKYFIILIILFSCKPLLSTRADQCKKNEDEKCQSYQTQTPALEKTKFSPLCSDPNNTSDDIKPVMLTEEELAKLLVDVEKEMSSLITLKTDMTQEKHLAMFNDVLRSKGVCIFQKPDKVRMDTISPYRSSLITSGNRVVKYNFSNDKWVKLKLPSKDIVLMITHQIAGFIQGKFDTKDSIYDISAYKGRSTTVVLTPKNEKLKETLNRIEISLSEDRYKITSVTIYEEGEDFTLMRFNNELENIELPKDTFDTHPAEPTDVKIPSPPIYLKTKSSDTKTEKEK